MSFKNTLLFIILFGLAAGSCEFEEINYQSPVPVALEAQGITSSGFLASWSLIEGADSYTVLLSQDSEFDVDNLVEGYPRTTSETTFWVSGLEADQAYYYAVKVSDNSGPEYSNVITVQTEPLAPPLALDARDVSPLSFTAQWNPVPEAENYLLYISTDINFTDLLEGYDGKVVSDTTAVVNDLDINTDYFYRVKTLRGRSVSAESNAIRVSTSQLSKPVLLEASNIDFTSFTINWEAVEGATSYLIFVATDLNVITEVLPEYNPLEVTGGTSRIIVGLDANTSYYYRVQAKNLLSESEKSEIGVAYTDSLEAPVARNASTIQIDKFQANWSSVQNASSYVLDVSRNKNFTDFLNGYNAKEIVDTTEIISGLLRNTFYYYRVRAKGFGSVSNNSNRIVVQTVSFASPRALEAVELQPTSFRAVWQSVEGASSYRIDVATDANFESVITGYSDREVNDTTLQVTGLTVNRRYFYRVRALAGTVTSGYSNIVDLTTTSLSEPVLLSATDVQLTSFTINWEAVVGATQYRVDVGFDPLVENMIGTDFDNRLVTGTSLNVTGLNANTTYYYKVRAENDVSTSGSSVGSSKTSSINPPVAENPTDIELTSFQANWSVAANADSYLLDVATDPSFSNLVPNYNGREVTSGLTSEVVTGLAPNQFYYYRLRSKGLGTISDYSNIETAKTDPLSPPDGLNTTDIEVYRFTANWNAVDGADRYVLDVATTSSFDPSSILPDYDGKEVLGTSHTVVGLDPYTTYYYRLSSQQSITVSSPSTTVTVDARISNSCRLIERDFTDWRREEYTYSGGLLSTIDLYDTEGSPSLIRRTTISYNGNDRVQEASVTASGTTNQWVFTYETGVNGDRIDQITISTDDAIPVLIETIDFTYGFGSDRPISVTYASGTEQYVYSSNEVLVNNGSGDLIKELQTDANFNTLSMLSSDVALLLFNPTNPGERLLPFISNSNPVYYQHRDDAGSAWEVFPYTYEYNDKRVPIKVRATNSIPDVNYLFTGCNF